MDMAIKLIMLVVFFGLMILIGLYLSLIHI